MRKAIESCLVIGEALEVIIVNDGSTDATKEIADEYATKFPVIVKAVHQPNKGHGGAVNTGMALATGRYFKVLDSDDWLDEDSLIKIVDLIKNYEQSNISTDMIISDFVYEQENSLFQKTMKYNHVFPIEQKLSVDNIGKFRGRQYLLMHSLIFRTEVLRKSQLQLPEHTFYVDNLYVFIPLQYVNSFYYLNVPLYRYFIGRDDQSVNEKMMMKRVDQQVKVNKLLIDAYGQTEHINKKLNDYLIRHIQIVTLISTAILNKINTSESIDTKDHLWDYLKKQVPSAHKQISRTLSARIMNVKGKNGRKISNTIYKAARKVARYG